MKPLLLILCAISFLIGPSQRPDTAVIYFYRVEEAPKMDSRKASVKLGGKDFFTIPENNFIAFRLPVGDYGLRMRQKQSEILLRAEPGKRYFIRVSQTVAGFGFNQSLTLMSEEQAVYQMREMKPLEDKNIKDKTKEAIRNKPIP